MKTIFLVCFIIAGFICNAQPKIAEHAFIITKVNLKLVDAGGNESNDNVPSFGRNTLHTKAINGMSEGENRIVTYYKEDKIKITNDINMGTNTIIIDKKANKTITLIEVMGIRTGFYSTEENAKQMKELVDSLYKKRRLDSLKRLNDSQTNFKKDSLNIHIEYFNDNRTIAGFNCKKAQIIKHSNSRIDSMYVWYCPEFKLKQGFNMPAGIAGAIGPIAFDLLNGFPMKYETTDIHGNKVNVEVKKIDINKEIKDKEFDVPNGYDLKPMNRFSVIN